MKQYRIVKTEQGDYVIQKYVEFRFGLIFTRTKMDWVYLDKNGTYCGKRMAWQYHTPQLCEAQIERFKTGEVIIKEL